MSSFDALLGRILDNGSEVELRGGLNFIGVTISQNEALNCLNVTFTGVEAGGDNRIGYAIDEQLSFTAGFEFDPDDGAGAFKVPAGATIESNDVHIASVLATDVYLGGATGSGTIRYRPGGTGGRIGFYGTTPIVKQTGVAVTAAAIHAALVNLGLIAA